MGDWLWGIALCFLAAWFMPPLFYKATWLPRYWSIATLPTKSLYSVGVILQPGAILIYIADPASDDALREIWSLAWLGWGYRPLFASHRSYSNA